MSVSGQSLGKYLHKNQNNYGFGMVWYGMVWYTRV